MSGSPTLGGGYPTGSGVGKSARREDILVDGMKGKLQSQNAANFGGGGGEGVAVPIGKEQQYERLQQVHKSTNENLLKAIRTSHETHDIGYTTVQELGKQRETIQRTIERVDETQGNLDQAKRVLRDIRMGEYKDFICKGLVIVALVLIIILLFYAKFIKK